MKLAASFSTEPEAYIAKGMLEDNGIDAVVVPNNMATLYAAGAAWAPIELYVPDGELERAQSLLAEHE